MGEEEEKEEKKLEGYFKIQKHQDAHFDGGRYLTSHGSHCKKRDAFSSFAIVHAYTEDNAKRDVWKLIPQGGDDYIIQKHEAAQFDGYRYLSSHSYHCRKRDANSSFAIV